VTFSSQKCAITVIIKKATFSLATRVGSRTRAGPSLCAAILVQQTFKAY
jgi:hypothetical protein